MRHPNSFNSDDVERVLQLEADKKVVLLRAMILFSHLSLIEKLRKPLAKQKLFLTHVRILFVIYNSPGISVGDLRKSLRLSHQAIYRPMNDLIGLGFITQETGASDRRVRHLFLTEDGEGAIGKLGDYQDKVLIKDVEPLTDEDWRGFFKVASCCLDPIDVKYIHKNFLSDPA